MIDRSKPHVSDLFWIETAVARYFGVRRHIIVPNVSWGLHFHHELDLMVITKNNYAYEIEIKTSIADLKADRKKRHNHKSNRIKKFWFALPERIEQKAIPLLREGEGLLVIRENKENMQTIVKEVVKPVVNKSCRSLTNDEVLNAARLGTMRIWGLKETMLRQWEEQK